ncbi:MAG: ribosome small subunit-dependent GTPase A [Dehalococcoidia bacterium]|nr:ribosome small subunit-dependent GTPase A [Dehalococcoidia bacterium]
MTTGNNTGDPGAAWPKATERLIELGWSDFFARHLQQLPSPALRAGRVIAQHRGALLIGSEFGDLRAEMTGRLVHEAGRSEALPAVGDWVAFSQVANGAAQIHAVLPRKSKFSRKVAGSTTDEQVVAANIDYAFIVSALTAELNMRRLERYLTVAWESGAQPVVVLAKADLREDAREVAREVGEIAVGAPVLVTSALSGEGFADLMPYLGSHSTVCLIGSSGVGKSSLVNRLLGEERQVVRQVRSDDRGRHTTAHRELFRLPQGALIIDTPGMRELQLWGDPTAARRAFADLEEAASGCRFTDCRHEAEPGCAVRDAVAAGLIEARRLDSFHRLHREMQFLEIKQDRRARSEEKRKHKVLARSLRRHYQQ